MRWPLALLLAGVVVVIVLLENPRDDDDFPPVQAQRHGFPSLPVADRDESEALCLRAHKEWPPEWGAADKAVYLDEPGGQATVCVRQGAVKPGELVRVE